MNNSSRDIITLRSSPIAILSHEVLWGVESWKKCKQLGGLLDTKEDIKRRKILSQQAIQKLQHIWQDRRTPTNTKLRIFNACVKPIFLYNAELWTLTKTQENQINAYQRRLLRKILNIRWPQKISNEKLKGITKHDNWSNIISTARRLPETTPARRAIDEAERPTKHPQGGQKTTWLRIVQHQLNTLNTVKDQLGKAKEFCKYRNRWRSIVCEWRDRCEEEFYCKWAGLTKHVSKVGKRCCVRKKNCRSLKEKF